MSVGISDALWCSEWFNEILMCVDPQQVNINYKEEQEAA